MAKFHNPDDFPFEAFVERKVSDYFLSRGFQILDEIPYLDLHFKLIDNEEEWKIECKGETSSINVDFNTGLGQILKKMEDENSMYALALPDTPSFRKQVEQVPNQVLKKLNLHWIWVNEKGEVKIENP